MYLPIEYSTLESSINTFKSDFCRVDERGSEKIRLKTFSLLSQDFAVKVFRVQRVLYVYPVLHLQVWLKIMLFASQFWQWVEFEQVSHRSGQVIQVLDDGSKYEPAWQK